MSKPQVVVYGASGYTGKLIAEYLAKRGISFIAAGRSESRLKAELGKVPFVDRVEVQYAALEHTVEALTELFLGVKVVINVVGPFAQLGREVVQACLSAGAHYLDTTGEQDWVIDCKAEYGQTFADKKLVLAPATSWMWNAGLLAAEVALETSGIDSLDIVYAPNGNPSPASTKSFLRMCCQPQLKLELNKFQPWPQATAYEATVPGFHQHLLALPWSGGCEPVWYADDERVQNCSVLTAFTNRPMMELVVAKMKEFADLAPTLSAKEQEELTNAWGESICSTEPPREIEEINRVVISCWARGNTTVKHVVFFNTCGYLQTGVMAAELADRLLRNQHKRVGFTSAVHAVGHRELIAACAEEGMHCWEPA
ncbi:DUF5938 domain-containing protein [Pseudomonas sp. MPC6]|uniref:saccharopine dehydrogenase family protein n=1 Tax=unclassified Pseudomonas TaxID=196821 RepID=UPI0011102303|nr:DUF5938 domain-containing protein [Pseudomonas sp. MPC6]QCY09452.1 saccharopine dehydrogenase [Pseudomonas sp. MPC6]